MLFGINVKSHVGQGPEPRTPPYQLYWFQIVACLIATAVADASLGYYGQYGWPSAYGLGFQSTCYGCRIGKRSADAEPSLAWGPGVAVHPWGGSSFVGRTVWGLGKRSVEKREAEPSLAWGPGVAVHPWGGSSFVGRTVWGLGKRSVEKREAEAEAEAEPHWGYRGYGGYGNIHWCFINLFSWPFFLYFRFL